MAVKDVNGPGSVAKRALSRSKRSVAVLPRRAKRAVARRAERTRSPTPLADIEKLKAACGWPEDGFEARLLAAADAASPEGCTGQIGARGVAEYLAAPADGKLVSASSLLALQGVVGTSLAVTDAGLAPWQRQLASLADRSPWGTKTGTVTGEVMRRYVSNVLQSNWSGPAEDGGTVLVSDQREAALLSAIANLTGEQDPLRMGGEPAASHPVMQKYARICFDATLHIPVYVSYVMSPADIALRAQAEADGVVPPLQRTNNFRHDPDEPASSHPSDFLHSNLERGHRKDAHDSPNLEAMAESFLMDNMSPQTMASNSFGWQDIEIGTNELCQALEARMTIATGAVFLDASGKPAAPSTFIGASQVAVPTHDWKVVKAELPDGTVKMYAYLYPNRTDIPTRFPELEGFLQSARVSTAKLEELTGLHFFTELPPAHGAALKADATPAITFPEPQRWRRALRLWPHQPGPGAA